MPGAAHRGHRVVVGVCWIGSTLFAAGAGLSPISASWTVFVAACALGAVSLGLATLVLRRAPGTPLAGWLALAGMSAVVTCTVDGARLGAFSGSWMLLYLPFAILLLLVPTGHPAGPRWGLAGAAITAVTGVFIALCAAQWRWPGLSAPTMLPSVGLLLVFLGLLVVCAAAPVARYRHAGPAQRRQLRWVFLSGVSLPVTLLLCWASYLVLGNPDLVGIGLVVMYLAIPMATTIAVVRPGLFDIDRAAVATVTATLLSLAALIILSVAAASVGLTMTQWSPTAALGSTAALVVAAALAYRPLRRALDGLLYPERGRALGELAELMQRVDAGVSRPEEVEQVLRRAMRDPDLVIGYRSLTDGRMQTANGLPVSGNAMSVRVLVRGEQIGMIIPCPNRTHRPAPEIVSAAAPMMDAARLTPELARATAETEASRQRMLRAGYQERRRLERDLHDGAQQRLVALGMRLRVLQRTAGTDAGVCESLDTAVAELGTAVAELRQLAHGVRPSALDDGLAFALSDLARQAPGIIELDVHAAELPDAVATTAYYVVSEAVTNALRHAGASRIVVAVHHETHSDRARTHPHQLRVRVTDDGCGGAGIRGTGGLTGLHDRVGALGGSLSVASPTGAGTLVEAVLPCGS